MGKNNQQRRAAKRKARAAGQASAARPATARAGAHLAEELPAGPRQHVHQRSRADQARALITSGAGVLGDPAALEDAVRDLVVFSGTGAPGEDPLLASRESDRTAERADRHRLRARVAAGRPAARGAPRAERTGGQIGLGRRRGACVGAARAVAGRAGLGRAAGGDVLETADHCRGRPRLECAGAQQLQFRTVGQLARHPCPGRPLAEHRPVAAAGAAALRMGVGGRRLRPARGSRRVTIPRSSPPFERSWQRRRPPSSRRRPTPSRRRPRT